MYLAVKRSAAWTSLRPSIYFLCPCGCVMGPKMGYVSGRELYLGHFPFEGEMGFTDSLSYIPGRPGSTPRLGPHLKIDFQHDLCDQRSIINEHHYCVVPKGRIKISLCHSGSAHQKWVELSITQQTYLH